MERTRIPLRQSIAFVLLRKLNSFFAFVQMEKLKNSLFFSPEGKTVRFVEQKMKRSQ